MKKLFFLLLLTVFLTSCQVSFWKPSERHLINGQHGVMRVLTIKNPKDSVALRKTSARLSHRALTSPVFTRLVQGMLTTVTSPEQDGVGIAAPQVGIFRRVVAVQRLDKDEEPFEVYPNIRITAHRGPLQVGQEGCLSVPNEWGGTLTSNIPPSRPSRTRPNASKDSPPSFSSTNATTSTACSTSTNSRTDGRFNLILIFKSLIFHERSKSFY